ncbi:MAG: FecR domain-containing protein, partial [Myxococcales bacterium]
MPLALLSLILALLVPSLAFAAAGKVTFLSGSVERVPKDGAPVALALDGEVEQGDTIRTGPDSRVQLALVDGSVLRLNERSVLRLDRIEQRAGEKSWQVKLQMALGAVWARVAPRESEAPRFEIGSDRVVAGVRGTQFIVQADEAHTVVVLEGAVDVAGASGQKLGAQDAWSLLPQTAIVVDREGKTEGVIGIDG